MKKIKKIYQPRLEIRFKGKVKDTWQEWGQFAKKKEAIKVTKDLLNNIKEGKYNSYIKEKGYSLNTCIEVLDANTFDLLYIEGVCNGVYGLALWDEYEVCCELPTA